MAHWDEDLFGHPPTVLPANTVNPSDASFRPFKIDYFARASFDVNGDTHQFVCAMVSWFEPHPARFELGKPVQVWCNGLFESVGEYSFLPLDLLY